VLDSAAWERAGVPTVTVVTRVFEIPARAQARQAGLPDLAIITIPDKVDWQTESELEDIARSLVAPVVRSLTGQPEKTLRPRP
jgi:hypothetical protein